MNETDTTQLRHMLDAGQEVIDFIKGEHEKRSIRTGCYCLAPVDQSSSTPIADSSSYWIFVQPFWIK